MRHFSKTHLPNKEWKKTVRFNGKDYLLQSVFDQDNQEELSKTNFLGYEIYKKWFNKIVDDADTSKKRSPFLSESYFSDLEDEFEEEFTEDEEEVDNSLPIIVEDSTGNDISIIPSENPKKNAVFYMLSKIAFINYESGTTVDDILLNAGKYNERESFRLMINQMRFVKGRIRFMAEAGNKHYGHIQVYFTSQDDLRISITYPGICTVRGQRKEFVTLEGDDIQNIIPELPASTAERGSEEYYTNLITKFVERCPRVKCSFALLKKTRDYEF